MLNTLYKEVCLYRVPSSTLCWRGRGWRGRGGGEGRGGERERERKGIGGAGECAGYAHRRGRDTIGRLFVAEKGEEGRRRGGRGGRGRRERETEKVQNKKLPWSSVSHC